MLAVRVWLIYLTAVFVGGPLLAPWVFWLANVLAGAIPGLEFLTHQPFSRYVTRCLQGVALAGMWPLIRSLRLRSWQTVGWVPPGGQGPALAMGFALGSATLASVAAVALASGGRSWHESLTAAAIARSVLSALLTAGAVAVIEETLFRGALMGTLRKELNWMAALAISSALYAWLHFLTRTSWTGPVRWDTGFAVLGQMLGGLFHWRTLVPGAVALAIAGGLLGYAFQRTGNLYFSIGVHAGWIAVLKLYRFATVEPVGVSLQFWGTGRLIDGWVATVAIVLSIPIACWLLGRLAHERGRA